MVSVRVVEGEEEDVGDMITEGETEAVMVAEDVEDSEGVAEGEADDDGEID